MFEVERGRWSKGVGGSSRPPVASNAKYRLTATATMPPIEDRLHDIKWGSPSLPSSFLSVRPLSE